MTNKSTKRRNAVIAAVSGAALLIGGSTYALWQASAGIDGGNITAGNLDIKAATMNAWDISSDRHDSTIQTIVTSAVDTDDVSIPAMTLVDADQGHAIEPTTWRMVPGDKVAMTFPYKVTLEGDNLVASLYVAGDFGTDVTDDLVALTYQVFDENGKAVTAELDVPLSADPNGFLVSYFQASNDGQDDGTDDAGIPIIPAGDDNSNSAVITFVLYASFDKDNKTVAQEDVTKDLVTMADSVTATLTQVRCSLTAGENFTDACSPTQPEAPSATTDPGDEDEDQ